jgi:uncharacterized protein (TIGR03437 family)
VTILSGDGMVLPNGTRLRFVGVNRHTKGEGIGLLPSVTNYVIGRNECQWRLGVANFSAVRFRSVYPGVDLLYHGEEGSLEYDLVVSPGADPSRIRMATRGVCFISLPSISLPIGVAGTLASVAVINQGTGTAPVDVLLAPVAPAIFAADGSGAGPAAILNQDGKLNTPLHPAQQGEFISIYATGGGQTNPAESDGQVVTGTPKLALPVEVTIGGLAAEVVYAGGAPTLVAGAIQINARVPANAPTGPGVPITLTVGGVTSAPLVTVAIRGL